jgi:hypothetical protein
MGHNISAIILKSNYDKSKAERFDLFGKDLPFGLTLFHIDDYQTACWQYEMKTTGLLETSITENFIFPNEIAIAEVITIISTDKNPLYALIKTDYFGGIGKQYASVYRYKENIDLNAIKINEFLVHLGVIKDRQLDEFDTIGLDKIRSQPDIFEK